MLENLSNVGQTSYVPIALTKLIREKAWACITCSARPAPRAQSALAARGIVEENQICDCFPAPRFLERARASFGCEGALRAGIGVLRSRACDRGQDSAGA